MHNRNSCITRKVITEQKLQQKLKHKRMYNSNNKGLQSPNHIHLYSTSSSMIELRHSKIETKFDNQINFKSRNVYHNFTERGLYN